MFRKSMIMATVKAILLSVTTMGLVVGCLTDEHDHSEHNHTHYMYVAHEGVIAAYNLETGEQLAGEISNVSSPSDMQALEDGTVLVNLTNNNQVLAFDGKTMLEKSRLTSSSLGATRPVHSFITPTINNQTYWVAMNDGNGTKASNSATFIDITQGRASYLKVVGEVPLGIGHHKATFSPTIARVVISNIGDTSDVLTVFDYSNPADIKKISSVSAGGLGYARSLSPHGCGTSSANGKGYCNLTGTGDIVSVDFASGAFKILKTSGSGAGYTKGNGRYVYSLQSKPREADALKPGSACQIGQIVVIDAQVDSVVAEVPLKYGSTSCIDSVTLTSEKTAGPGHIIIAGSKMYIQVASGSDSISYATKHLVVDIANPALPVQIGAIGIGKSRSHHGEALAGDLEWLIVANNLDGTVSKINAVSGVLTSTITVKASPKTVTTWHEHKGPSIQTGPVH